MTLINTVNQQEGELLISLIRRVAVKNGLDMPDFLREYVFDEIHEFMPSNRDLETFTGANCYIRKFIEACGENATELFLGTGIYPGIAPFLPSYIQSRRINAAFRGCNLYPKLIGTIHNDIPVLKYCPVCAAEDRMSLGLSRLHRAHHMPNVTSCCKHGVDLVTIPAGEFLRNGIPETEDATVVSSDIAVQYALFAEGLLRSPMDTNWWSVREPLLKYIDASLIHKYAASGYEKLFGTDSASFFALLKKKNMHVSINCILAGLFAVYGNVADIEVAKDGDLMERFIEKSAKEYEIVGCCSHLVVEMVSKKDGRAFITTPWGFLAGWREYDDEARDEDRKFRQIVRNLTGVEIRPAEPFKGYFYSMDFLQRGTGNIFHSRVESVIEGLRSFEDKRRRTTSEVDVRNCVESTCNFRLVRFDGVKNPLTITCLSCGHTFTVSYNAWKKLKKCRVCVANEQKRNLIYHSTGKKYTDDRYDPAAAFAEKMKAITGTEYALVGEYEDIHTPTAFRHLTCGHTFTMTPNVFLNGGRCPRCRLPLGDDFKSYIHVRTNGQYEYVSRSGSLYTIVDTYTGKKYTLKKNIIIREIERPEMSEILPVAAKTGFTRSKTNIEKFNDYLACHMPYHELFTRRDISIDELSKDQVSRCIEKSLKKHVIERINRGTYRYLGENYVA